jgi:hypothetical protein
VSRRATEDLLATVQREIRASGFRVTPYRVGIKVAQARLPLPSPYATPHASRLFEQGRAHGLARITHSGGAA